MQNYLIGMIFLEKFHAEPFIEGAISYLMSAKLNMMLWRFDELMRILIALAWPLHVHHAVARTWLEEAGHRYVQVATPAEILNLLRSKK